MGTPEFAVPSLRILCDNKHPIVSVVTAPDKPKGRGQAVLPSPIKQFALQHELPILQPALLDDESFVAQLKGLEPDLFVVVAFRILPRSVFSIPKLGAFNLHASLLPKYRGAAPINWAIINGENETGVTTFFLEDRVDTGEVILQARVPIGPDATYGETYETLSDVGAEIVMHTCRLIEMGKALRRSQDSSQASVAPKIFKEQCGIDWSKTAFQVHNFVRGLSPVPCAYTHYGSKMLRVFRTRMCRAATSEPPGTICEARERLRVATGDGVVEIMELQQENRLRMSATEFLRGSKLAVGDRFT